MTSPLTSTEGLRVGMVVQIAVEMSDKISGQPYWWKRFAAVTEVQGSRYFTALTLKMNPDPDKDLRTIRVSPRAGDPDLPRRGERREIVTILPEPWPQGVAAMHMKLAAQGVISLGN